MSKTMLVSGASRGIGRAIVEHLLAAGHRVIGCSRSASSLVHERYTHLAADVASEPDVQALFRQVTDQFGALDALINNAGTGRMLPVALTPVSTVHQILNTNFVGTFLMTHAALRLLRKSPSPRIVNFTTVAVPLRLEGEAVYAAAKSAVETFTRILAKEVGPWGITCNAIGPSPIRTQLIENVPEEKLAALVARQAIPRWAEPKDVTHVLDFFLHPASQLVTGQVVYLGGVS